MMVLNTGRALARVLRGVSPPQMDNGLGMAGAHPAQPVSRRDFVGTVFAVGAAAPLAACAGRVNDIDPVYLRQAVQYETNHAPGTIVVDPGNHFLYHVQKGGEAVRYGVGVGGEGFGWSGRATVHDKQEWPDWYPTKDILARKPDIRSAMVKLPSGLGVPGGPDNPLGARALYLWQGNKDTLYRIHGTNEPWTIGKSVSAGCIRMINQEVTDLYDSTRIGTTVVVLPSAYAAG
jgi:lipoprotein-anchoring transpeptidase ErfK/SrfK